MRLVEVSSEVIETEMVIVVNNHIYLGTQVVLLNSRPAEVLNKAEMFLQPIKLDLLKIKRLSGVFSKFLVVLLLVSIHVETVDFSVVLFEVHIVEVIGNINYGAVQIFCFHCLLQLLVVVEI